jgi:hypothetical protein
VIPLSSDYCNYYDVSWLVFRVLINLRTNFIKISRPFAELKLAGRSFTVISNFSKPQKDILKVNPTN